MAAARRLLAVGRSVEALGFEEIGVNEARNYDAVARQLAGKGGRR